VVIFAECGSTDHFQGLHDGCSFAPSRCRLNLPSVSMAIGSVVATSPWGRQNQRARLAPPRFLQVADEKAPHSVAASRRLTRSGGVSLYQAHGAACNSERCGRSAGLR